MKRTNIEIDPKKISQLKKAFGLKTTKEIVDLALTELLRSHRRKSILDFQGKVKLEIDLDESRGSA